MTQTQVRENPFPGLRPFELGEEHLFFGREGLTDELLVRLKRNRFLAVVGISGSGKSSLVRAGLLPSLYSGSMTKVGSSWRVAIFRPGDNPIGNLANSLTQPEALGTTDEEKAIRTLVIETILRRSSLGLVEVIRQANLVSNENLLIVVDQFEELFRFKQSIAQKDLTDEAAAFVKLLLEAAQKQKDIPIYVVLTMRSDFLGDCTQFRDLPETLNDSQYLIPRMTRDQRRSAIMGPVAVEGGEITPQLVNRLLNDIGEDPDQLPILQHALMRAWDYWAENHAVGEPIDLKHYDAIGGTFNALSRHADEIYEQLPNERCREIAEKLFKRLTYTGSDNREVRQPTRLSEVCAVTEAESEEVIDIVESFRGSGESFLMPPAGTYLDEETVLDISHESLIRIWRRLKDWMIEEAESAQRYRRLAETATMHERGETGFLQNPELERTQIWFAQYQPNAAWAKRFTSADFDLVKAFLDDSEYDQPQQYLGREQVGREQVRSPLVGERELLKLPTTSEHTQQKINEIEFYGRGRSYGKDTFISYAPKDQEFVQILSDELRRRNYEVWVDWQNIPSTSIWWDEIKAGIEVANTFIFVISPDSVVSEVCYREIDHAASQNKRLIPIVRRDGFQTRQVHPALSRLNWLFFREQDNFERAFQALVKAIDTDLEYVRTHTRLLVRAIEWDDAERDQSFLLHGKDLEASEQWLARNRRKSPIATNLHKEYIFASQQLQKQLSEAEASHQQTEKYLQTAERELKKAVIYHKPKRRRVLLTGTFVTFLVLIIRFLGILQPLELAAFDWLMRLRPSEGPDDRFLIVEIAEDDIHAQIKKGERPIGSLSDISLNSLLDKLEQYQPRLIGLDIYRNYSASQPDLETRLKNNNRLFSLCKVAETDAQGNVTAIGIAPPPEVQAERVGFSDLVEDKDGVIRRHLLMMSPEKIDDSACHSKSAFSLLIAKRYLELQLGGRIQYSNPLIADGPLQIDGKVFERLEIFTGGYQLLDNGGYQILLNYRAYKKGKSRDSFRTVKLEEVLNERLPKETFKDRIVLIGVTATSSVVDYWPTPYGTGPQEQLAGVFIQAHMISQLISAVLDERPLLWVWPQGIEALWILGWSLVGGILTLTSWRRRYVVLVAVGIALGGLYLICFALMIQAGWIPLVPSALSLLGTSVVLMYTAFRPASSPNSLIASERKSPVKGLAGN